MKKETRETREKFGFFVAKMEVILYNRIHNKG